MTEHSKHSLRQRARALVVDAYRLLICAAVGALTGVIATLFREAVAGLEKGVHGAAHWAGEHTFHSAQSIVLASAPILGGLIVGYLVFRVIRVHAGHGVPAVITAAAADRPMTDQRMAYKACTSIVTIGSGGSAGPEGPIVELGAVLGSFAWKWCRLPGHYVRIMMGCGSAAGIAAIFNVPIGGVVFVLDVVLRDYSVRSMTPLMIASVSASTVSQAWTAWSHGGKAFDVPPVIVQGDELLYSPLLGIAAAVAAALFIRANFAAADWWRRVRVPGWVLPGVGGAAAGLIGLASLQLTGHAHTALGEGYHAIETMLDQGLGTTTPILLALGAVILFRVMATASTLGSGGTGGAFAPSLVIGTAVGLMIARVAGDVFGARIDNSGYALIGMAGMIAGTFQAPLSGLIIALNLSRWTADLILPLMCVTVMSAWLTHHLARASVYELGLLREGVDLQASRSLQQILAGRSIEDIIRRPIESMRRDATLGQVIDALTRTHQSIFPVVDGDGCAVGLIHMDELRAVLRESFLDESLIAADLMEPLENILRTTDSLAAAWERFNEIDDDEVLVVEPDRVVAGKHHPVGLVRRSDVVGHVRWG